MPIGVEESWIGYDTFTWFVGVVEDINDPEEVSRVKVRVLGHHTSKKSQLKTNQLHWATVMMPNTSASVSGIGFSPHGLVNGSHVFGFFMDGEYAQYPVIMGSWHGIPQEAPDPNVGFNDPDGVYPKEIDEPDTSKLARGTNTIEDIIDASIENPESPYAAVYPNNKVIETTSGHIIELDDTPDAERIRLYHGPSGTRFEIHPNGDIVQVNGDSYKISIGDDRLKVTGTLKIVVDGNADISVGNNAFVAVENNMNATIGKNMAAVIGNDLAAEVINDCTLTIGNNLKADVANNASLIIGTSADVTVPTTKWTGNINLTGDLNITGSSTASVDHISAGISGKSHTHTDSAGLSAGTTSEPQ